MPLLSRHVVAFLAAVVRSPVTVGAVVPSSSLLAARLAAVVPRAGMPVVVELGPGTGSVTTAIECRLGSRGRHVAVEIDPKLAEYLRIAHPQVDVLVGDAIDLERLLVAQHVSAVDVVISGLPWSLISPDTQRAIVEATARSLSSGGCFTTFAYVHGLSMPWARQFRALLGEVFDEVLTTRMVWWNLPPAVTYVCRRPHAGSQERGGHTNALR